MTKMFDVSASSLIEATAEDLKKINHITPPEWAVYVKTGVHKQRAPLKSDWWYTRAAAILRSVYLLGPIGTEKLRVKYGGKKNRGVAPEHHKKGSGNIIRTILKQLEAADLVKQGESGMHKGRIITGKGQSALDKAALASTKA